LLNVVRLPAPFAIGLFHDPFENLDRHAPGFGRSCVDSKIKRRDAVVFEEAEKAELGPRNAVCGGVD
jgi:hypothetical protein